MPEDLTLDDLARFRDLGTTRYQVEVIRLFMSGAAEPEHWAALAAAVLHVSESNTGHRVLAIDKAILQRTL
jgi:hypothetical protein